MTGVRIGNSKSVGCSTGGEVVRVMEAVRSGLGAAADDVLGRKVEVAREQLPEFLVCVDVEARVTVLRQRPADFVPVLGGQILLRSRQDHLGLQNHVRPFERREALDRVGEAVEPAGRIRLVTVERFVHFRDELRSGGVLALELVERVVELRRAQAQLAEQVLILLRVVQRVGE